MGVHVIIGGNGAVGAIYGQALAKAGEKVILFVKTKYLKSLELKQDDAERATATTTTDNNNDDDADADADDAAATTTTVTSSLKGNANKYGIQLYQLRRRKKAENNVFRDFAVISSEADLVALPRCDFVWLPVSAPAAKGIAPMLKRAFKTSATLSNTCIVGLHEDHGVRTALLDAVGGDKARVVFGHIAFHSFQAPLKGAKYRAVPDGCRPGVAFYFPPGGESLFEGVDKVVNEVVTALKKGGCPAKVDQDAPKTMVLKASYLQSLVAQMGVHGWQFDSVNFGDATKLACELVRVKNASLGASASTWLVWNPVMRLILKVGPSLMPYDLEAFVVYHFQKVEQQMYEGLESNVKDAEKHNIEVPVMKKTVAAWKKVMRGDDDDDEDEDDGDGDDNDNVEDGDDAKDKEDKTDSDEDDDEPE